MRLVAARIRRGAAALLTAVLLSGRVLVAADVDSLELGLVGYLAFEGDLRSVTPAGEETAAGFERQSQAWTDELRVTPVNDPRFAAGRFGLGILLEPGSESESHYEARNWLPPETAQVIPRGGAVLPFVASGAAAVGVIQATDDEARGPNEPILEGKAALHVACPQAGGGVEMRSPVAVLNGSYTASVFVRGEADAPADDRVQWQLLDSTTGAVLGSAEQTVTAVWSRLQLNAEVGTFSRDLAKPATTPVALRLSARRAGQVVLLDAFMLEMRGGYADAGTGSAASWLPGLAWRAAEGLDLDDLRPCLAGQSGALAMWLRLRACPQARRTLFELASPNRWEPHLQVALLDDRRLLLGQCGDAPAAVETPVTLAPDAWHHIAVTWTADRAALYVDGTPVSAVSGLSIPIIPSALHLASGGPNTAASVVLDEVWLYNRPLSAVEVQRLAQADRPGVGLALPTVTLRPQRFIETIAHGWAPQPWRCELRNAGVATLQEVDVTFRLGSAMALTQRLERVAAGGSAALEFNFLADLAVGTYPLTVTAGTADQELARFHRQVDITPAPEPAGNLQVLPWQRTFDRSYGFTCGGGDLAETMRQGLGWAPHHPYLGYPRALEGEDRVRDMNDRPGRARFSSPYMVEQVRREAARYAERLAAVPAVRAVTFNSEAQWIWSHDYTPESVLWVRHTFHLDLDAWRQPPRGNQEAHQLPFGRLLPAVAGITPPTDRIVTLTDPLYAYHRWFHGPHAPTESFLNQTLSAEVRARRADVLTIQEPILRRPAVRAFDRVSIAQEGFSYEDPMNAVMVQEGLNAAVCGTELRPSGMPQFLFKAGGAAPYNAMPTADLFREAAWLCALQPIRLFTYWNFEVVPRPDFADAAQHVQTQAQIETRFGSAQPAWEDVKRVLSAEPELARTLLPWTPELVAAFRHFHGAEVGPLGALIPAWRNRPRRVAILRSFASQLYGDVRWPATTWLEACVVGSGVPFDLLLDEDFEARTDPLASYQLVVVSAAACLPRPAVEALQRFSARGGAVVTDPETRVSLPGAQVLRPLDMAGATAPRPAPTARPAATGGNVGEAQVVEAMPNPLRAGGAQGLAEPAFLELFDRVVSPEARTLSPFTWLNLLEAEGVCYVGVVNDLRVHGPLYGHFGAVRETGVPHSARVRFNSGLGNVAYDLLTSQPVALSVSGDSSTATLDLPPAGARLLVLLPATIARLDLQAQVEAVAWGDHRGRQVAVRAALLDDQGRIVPGLIPATLTWRPPDGSRSDFSHHTVFRRGVLDAALPVLANGPSGIWQVEVLERASGRTAVVGVAVR
jgi:hypothetical protein